MFYIERVENTQKEKQMIQPTNAQQLYPQAGGANAVSINIYNPQAYGAGAQPQQVPYAYTNSLYQMPNASMYNQPVQNDCYQQYMPVQTPQVAVPQLNAPAPQMMPQSVLTPAVQQDPMQAQPQVAAEQSVTPEVVEQAPQAQTVNTDELIQGLKNTDLDLKAEAINKIAFCAQSEPETALQVVSEPIMQSLVEVINEDTTALEGPTEQQIQVAQKIAKGEQLTPEEEALSEQLSPRDKANKNRIFALYTLAMVQKLQRDELNEYIETQKANGEQAIAPLKIEDLMGYNDIVNVLKNDQRPEVKVAAIQALQHVATAEDKATIEGALTEALASQDPAIKAAADELMAKFAA